MDPQMPPMPQQMPPTMDMGQDPQMPQPQDDGMGGQPPMGDEMDGGEMPPMDNGNENSGESEFDTNFDAGVEADEDEDPQRYTQQLTGKLSQTLNKLVGDDPNNAPSICKYVGKMILKQVSKGIDEKGRKELIGTLNTLSDEPSEIGKEDDDDTEMNECRFTKKELMELAGVNPSMRDSEKRPSPETASLRNHPSPKTKYMTPKKFKN